MGGKNQSWWGNLKFQQIKWNQSALGSAARKPCFVSLFSVQVTLWRPSIMMIWCCIYLVNILTSIKSLKWKEGRLDGSDPDTSNVLTRIEISISLYMEALNFECWNKQQFTSSSSLFSLVILTFQNSFLHIHCLCRRAGLSWKWRLNRDTIGASWV